MKETVSEFELRVRKSSALGGSNIGSGGGWDPKIAKTELAVLNTKLKQIYGHDLVPFLDELGLNLSNISSNVGEAESKAQNDDPITLAAMYVIAVLSILTTCYVVYSHFIEDAEPHLRSSPSPTTPSAHPLAAEAPLSQAAPPCSQA